jgi:hypothetical protein
MSPKKRPAKEFSVERPSQALGGQDLISTEATILTTHIPETSHPRTSTRSHAAVVDARRLEGPTRQPSTQVEVFAINTAAPDLPPLSSQQQHNQDPHREAKAQEDQHQDSKDEIEARHRRRAGTPLPRKQVPSARAEAHDQTMGSH